jgi:hypothetical protein
VRVLIAGALAADVLDFNASSTSEDIDVSANGLRVRLFRNVASITQDVDGVERFDIAALAGPTTSRSVT